MGPILFVRNENIAHVMPHGTTYAMHACIVRCAPAGKPATYVYMAHQELLMDVPFEQAKRYLSKLTASHFGTLNMDFENQNVLKRIPIAMLNENKADCNENFRICAEESVAPLYKQ